MLMFLLICFFYFGKCFKESVYYENVFEYLEIWGN